MSFDLKLLQEQLCKELCGEVKLRKHPQGFIQVLTPFSFPDGDTFQVYLDARPGGARITDYGHTWMQLSYENEQLSKFHEGTRGKILDQILANSGVRDEDGQLIMDTTLDKIGASIVQYGQALTRIYDITFLNRGRLPGTFYEDLKEALYRIVPADKIEPDYVLPDYSEAESYLIDFKIQGKRAPLFLFGIASRDKARLVTITLEHWLRTRVDFDSLLIFQDQKDIPRMDIARLSNAGGEMVASLDASEDFHRKVIKLAA